MAFSVLAILILAAWFIRPVLAADDAPAPNPALQAEVDALKERVDALERLVGQERESRPSVTLRLRSLEISVDELERQGDDDGDRDADRAIGELSRQLDTAEMRIDRLERNDISALERRVDGNERNIRQIESRVRRLE